MNSQNEIAEKLIEYAESVLQARLTEYQKQLLIAMNTPNVQIQRNRQWGVTTLFNIVSKFNKDRQN